MRSGVKVKGCEAVKVGRKREYNGGEERGFSGRLV